MNRELKVLTEYYPIGDGKEERKEVSEEVQRRSCVVGPDDIRR